MNIAIVDDESCWRETAQKVINNYTGDKDRIEMFSSGMEFLKKDKYYDVVIMDVEMPDLNGFETITEYNKSNKNSIVIILTTHLDCARQGFLVNAFRYIDKLNMQNELEEAFGAIQKINENKFILKNNINLIVPEMKYCTDNAAMIGAAGYYAYKLGRRANLYLNAKATDKLN